jgi:methionyl-tRNA formyltransferase
MKIGWIGFHMEGVPAFESVLKNGYNIEALITLNKKEKTKKSGIGNYEEICQKYDVPIYRVSNINSDNSIEILNELSLDIVFVIGWSQIIGKQAMNKVSIGMIGAHASLLPNNKGSAPVNWSIIKGDTKTGNTLIWFDEKVDRGDIIDQREIIITKYDTCNSVYKKVAFTNKDMILEVLPKLLSGDKPGYPQPEIEEDLLPRRRPEDGLINWNQSKEDVYNFIRALTRPYPGAFSILLGEKWYIWEASLIDFDFDIDAEPGEIVGKMVSPNEKACGILVACENGIINLLELENEKGEILNGQELSESKWEGLVFKNE